MGCFLFTLLLLAGLAAGAWLFRGQLFDLMRGRQSVPVATEPATPELAEAAELKLDRLRAGDASEVSLSAAEIESLLRFRYAGLLPGFVEAPRIGIAADRVRIAARIPTDRLPRLDELGTAADFFPDTAEIEVEGRLGALDDRRATFAVDAVEIARIPLPDRIVPALLDRLGRTDEPGLPADALAVPLPPGTTALYVRGDSLVLVARAAAGRN